MKYEYKGKMYSETELAKIAGITPSAMGYRLATRKTVEEAMSDIRHARFFKYKGEKLTIKEIAERTGYSKNYLYQIAKNPDAMNRVLSGRRKSGKFRNILKMLEYAGISKSSFYCAVHRGTTLKEFFYGNNNL